MIRAFAAFSILASPNVLAAPIITGVTPDRHGVPRYERLELEVALGTAYANPFDPDEIDLSSEFIAPSGKKWKVNGFWNGMAFKIRFAGNEPGIWKYAVTAKDATGSASAAADTFTIVPSARHGWIRIAPNQRYYRFDDGAPYHGMGLGYPWNVKEKVLDSLKAAGANSIVYWNSTFDGEGNGGGQYLIESMESGMGRYDMRKGERIDQILDWLEARDMKMIFCIWPHPFLGDEINPAKKAGGWEAFYDVNPYHTICKARDFFDDAQSWNYQRKMYRYMLARWGYSEAVDHWWTVVETPGTDAWSLRGPQVVEAWSQKVHDFFKLNDPFGHPTSGSQQGNEEDYWANGYRIFDVANREIYFNGSSYASVVQETGKLWTQFQKPIVIGEIGNYISPKTLHQALWSGLACGAASTPYWWNYPDKWSPEKWDHLRAYAAFAKDIPFGDLANLQRLAPAVTGASAYAIQADKLAFGWILNDNGTAGGKSIQLQGLADGPYKLEWYDTWKGVTISSTRIDVTGGKLAMQSPATTQADIAFRVRFQEPVGIAPSSVPAPAAPQAILIGSNLWITSPSGAPFAATLSGLDGRRILAAESRDGHGLRLAVPGNLSGLHFLRMEWRGGSRVRKLML